MIGRMGFGGEWLSVSDKRMPRRTVVRAVLGMGLAAPAFVVAATRGHAQEASPVASPGATPAGGAASVTKEPFGSADGEAVDRYTLTNANGVEVKILTYGGIVQSIVVPDRDGNPGNVVLGFATLDEYVAGNPYFGCITGRYANRIALGTFTLDGEDLPAGHQQRPERAPRRRARLRQVRLGRDGGGRRRRRRGHPSAAGSAPTAKRATRRR